MRTTYWTVSHGQTIPRVLGSSVHIDEGGGYKYFARYKTWCLLGPDSKILHRKRKDKVFLTACIWKRKARNQDATLTFMLEDNRFRFFRDLS